MSTLYYLTTIDNPHSPVTEFDAWYACDREKGYDTCAYLNRVVEQNTEDYEALSQFERVALINSSIDEIIDEDSLGIYIKVPH